MRSVHLAETDINLRRVGIALVHTAARIIHRTDRAFVPEFQLTGTIGEIERLAESDDTVRTDRPEVFADEEVAGSELA